jgi:hypothetical protein
MIHEKLAEFENKGKFTFKGEYGVTMEYTNKWGKPYTVSSIVNVSTEDNRILTDHIWLKDIDTSYLESGDEIQFMASVNRYTKKTGEEDFRFNNYKLKGKEENNWI